MDNLNSFLRLFLHFTWSLKIQWFIRDVNLWKGFLPTEESSKKLRVRSNVRVTPSVLSQLELLHTYMAELHSTESMSESISLGSGAPSCSKVYMGVFTRDPYAIACALKRPPATHLQKRQFALKRGFQMQKTDRIICKSPSRGELSFWCFLFGAVKVKFIILIFFHCFTGIDPTLFLCRLRLSRHLLRSCPLYRQGKVQSRIGSLSPNISMITYSCNKGCWILVVIGRSIQSEATRQLFTVWPVRMIVRPYVSSDPSAI